MSFPQQAVSILRRSSLVSSIALALASPVYLVAQEAEVEQIIVTGSYIRNSDFTGASPVDTISQDALLNSGSANIGQYVRDLTYTQNVDTVANVLGGSGGGQDSNSAQFNLRGLGTSSTLTLFDGRRNINPGAISAILPDIATQRIEVVLDGGSALYGSDAVAGVVNIIPIKEFEGLRFRSFYSRDNNGDFEEPKLGVLFGKTFDEINLDLVTAFEIGKKTPLKRGERPKYLQVENATFFGAPGTFTTPAGLPYRDPDCATYNGDNTDLGKEGSFPSGFLLGPAFCGFHYGQWTDYNREASDNNFYINLSQDTTDWLTLEFQSTYSYRESVFHTEPLSPLSPGWYPSLTIPANHPANPAGVALTPSTLWTIINGYEEGEGAIPSYLNGNAYQRDRYAYITNTNKFGGTYEIGDSTWVGETWFSYQTWKTRYYSYEMNVDRLRASLNGMGGPSGDQWFNPFASRDINSPSYVAGVTNNSQEVTDWLFESGVTVFDEQRLKLFDSFVTGEVLQLPAGALSAAFGVQVRDVRDIGRPDPLSAIGANASTTSGISAPISQNTAFDSMTKAVFAEVEIPILENLSMQVAGRYENFTDLGLETTTPKVAVRWQPIDSLAIRASWGESFLAPAASQIGPIELTGCGTIRTGIDQLTNRDILGVQSCGSRSPFVDPETSEIKNIGFTWEGIEDLSISVDYQQIEYVDRIVSLGAQDTANQQFFTTLAAIGVSPQAYDNTPGSASRTAALAYVAANPSINVTRNAAGEITQLLTFPDNINSNLVDVIDFRMLYDTAFRDWGNFIVALDVGYYLKYDYASFDGVIIDGLGKRNADTALAPPLPKVKSSLRLSWNRDKHSASVLTRYTHGVTFDGTIKTGSTPPRAIDSSYIVNANYGYRFDDVFGASAQLSFGVVNLFNFEPRRLPVQGGFESRLYDNFGRQFFMSFDIDLI